MPPFSYTSFFGTGDTLDLSWRWAIYTAVSNHLQFGRQFLFTYGPLGFLDSPILGLSRSALLLAMILKLAGDTGLCYLAFIATKRLIKTYPRDRSNALKNLIIIATLLALLDILAQPLSTVLATLFVVIISSTVSLNGRTKLFAWICSGYIMGFDALDKTGFGLLFLAAVCYSLAIELYRQIKTNQAYITAPVMGLFSFLVSSIVLWIIAGQRLSIIVLFMQGEFQIISGYAEAMFLQGFPIDIWFALFLFAGLGLLTAATYKCRLSYRRSISHTSDEYLKLEAVAYLALFLFFFWKEGAVRQDPVIGGGHFAIIFIAILTVVMFRILVSPIQLARTSEQVFLVLVCTITIIFSSQSLISISPSINLQNIDNLIQVTSSRNIYNSYLATQKAELASSYAIPSQLLAKIGHSSVVILPYNLTIGPALGLNEVLLPVAQTYSAYTPYLDKLDTTALTKDKPRFVLLQLVDIDGRYPLFTAPALIDKILTSYRFVNSGSGFALFETEAHIPPHRIFHVTETGISDSWLRVPLCTGSFIDARIVVHQSLAGSVRSLFYRAGELEITLRRGNALIGPSRFIYSTANDGLDLTTMATAATNLIPFEMHAAKSQVQFFKVTGVTPNHWNTDFAKTFKVGFSCYR